MITYFGYGNGEACVSGSISSRYRAGYGREHGWFSDGYCYGIGNSDGFGDFYGYGYGDGMCENSPAGDNNE